VTRHWWTWAAYGAVLLSLAAGHVAWFMATHDPSIGARFGTALIGLGIIVTARPYFRTGLLETVNRQMPSGSLEAVDSQSSGHPLSGFSSLQLLRQQKAEHKSLRRGIMHDVVAERVIGVALILCGTLTNGYGDLPLRWMGYATK
jgi:hypothetical protein